jgi:hypothetical protein
MMCAVRAATLVTCVSAAALACCGAASAHLIPDPQFVATGGVSMLHLTGPNERQEPMTGLAVSVPSGLRIVRALPSAGWTPSVEGSTATWRGGPLAYWVEGTFTLELDVTLPPGQVTFETYQLYASDERVTWPVTLTIVPGDEPSQNLGRALAAGVVGLVVTVGLVLLAWRRRQAGDSHPR